MKARKLTYNILLFLLITGIKIPVFAALFPANGYTKLTVGTNISINGDIVLKTAGELYLNAARLDLAGNYTGEQGAELYLYVASSENGFLHISGSAAGETEIIPTLADDWDGSRIDLVKARKESSATGAFQMEEFQIEDYLVQVSCREQDGYLIWSIEKTKIIPCRAVKVGAKNTT